MEFHLEQWHWWALCLACMVIAAVIRGAFTLWLAAGAGVLGAVTWLTPEVPVMYQLMLFLLVSIGGAAISDFFVKPAENASQPSVPEEVRTAGERFIGRVVTLEAPIVNGFGKVEIDGEEWRVRGEDSPEGMQIIVLDADGIDRDLLIVERAQENT